MKHGQTVIFFHHEHHTITLPISTDYVSHSEENEKISTQVVNEGGNNDIYVISGNVKFSSLINKSRTILHGLKKILITKHYFHSQFHQ